jgi:hypothetical protein
MAIDYGDTNDNGVEDASETWTFNTGNGNAASRTISGGRSRSIQWCSTPLSLCCQPTGS